MIIQVIQQFDWIKAVYKTGSSVLPYINNANDEDYVFLIDENTTTKQKIELYRHCPMTETWVCNRRADLYNGVGAYTCHYAELIYGKNDHMLYDIFENVRDYKYKLVLAGYNVDFEKYKRFKFWYHILTGIYLLKNGKYELTDEQIANVRLCHDKQMTREIYDYIQGMLLEYKVQLGL